MSGSENKREQFPAIMQNNYIYLDSAATTQKPSCVIDSITGLYRTDSSNIHRGAHRLSQQMTQRYENARADAAAFIGAENDEVIFTHGATDGINLVARGLERQIGHGDIIAVTVMEHNSNFLPWQQLCQRTGAELSVIPVDRTGELSAETCKRFLTDRTKLLALSHIYNTTGCKNPVEDITALAACRGVLTLVDAAQSVAHTPINVKALGCDYLVFSGHKAYGPAGIGILYGKREALQTLDTPDSGAAW